MCIWGECGKLGAHLVKFRYISSFIAKGSILAALVGIFAAELIEANGLEIFTGKERRYACKHLLP